MQGSVVAARVQRGLNPGGPDAAASNTAQLRLNLGSAALNLRGGARKKFSSQLNLGQHHR